MSTTNTTSAAPKKKNVGYRLFAALLIIACVGICFLPISTITSLWNLEKQTLIDTVKAILASDTKLFGFLPVLASDGGVLSLVVNAAIYGFALTLVLACILSLIALFTAKGSPKLSRISLFLITWGAAAYAIVILCVSQYLFELTRTFDLATIAVAAGGAFFYFILALIKAGRSAWLCSIHFLLSLIVTGLLIYGLTVNGAEVAASVNGGKIYRFILLGALAFLMLNLFIASCRIMSKRGLSGDMVRHVIQLVVVLAVCFISYSVNVRAGSFLLFAIIAALVAGLQIVIATCQLVRRSNKKGKAMAKAAEEEALSGFEAEEFVEAYAYEGGPVAGVELAEEAVPTQAAVAGAVNVASLLGNGFDPFLIMLSDKEKEEFIDLYVLKCKGNMPEIPGYVVGGDNKDFFNKIFIYLGQYREKIPNDLLDKMYRFSMKLS